MARRLPSPPPTLPGFSYVHILGSGGFADVFLYEQNMPRRQVAVKVMLSEVVNDQVRQMFRAEANLMAQLSSHPAILTVYEASVSADGRPYLVMELCSASLSERYRRERIPVGEVLRIAVKIGSAVETAHRAGVLHRDIKPSNILTTAYGHPVLSDFGIASTLTTVSEEDSVGLSVPWSAPEVLLDETPGTIASEVWALAATVYSLLAGRSPFEDPGGSNTVLQFSTGDSVIVSGAGLVGRNPAAEPGEFFDQLVTIFDASKSVSKTHLEFGQEGGRFWVCDRFSTNGSMVRQPDLAPKRCEPGRRYFVARGSRVDIGEQFFVVS